MWLQKHIPSLQSSSQVVIFCCPLEYGIHHLIQDLDSHDKPVVWLELSPADQDDPVRIGNKLAEAVNKVFENQLLNSFSYEYNLMLLQSLLPNIGPITLVLTQAHLSPRVAKAVLKLHSKDCRVILQADNELKITSPAKSLKFTKDDFWLKPREALKLVAKRLDKKEVLELLKASNHAYDLFISNLNKKLKLALHLVPSPNGHRTLPEFDIKTKPEALLVVLNR